MEKMYQFKQKWKGSGEPVYTIEETLTSFTRNNPCQV